MFKRLFPLILLLAVLLSGCGAKQSAQETTTTHAAPQTVEQSEASSTPAATSGKTDATTTAASHTAATETSVPFSMPEKKGEMVFTDDPNDKFIQAIVQKYGADPARLACIYVVPEGDSNHVFEFNGKTDQNGKLIRNESTLKYVYTLNADCSEITRAGGVTGNDGLTAAQGLVIMQLTKELILPKFEKELNG